MYGIGQFAQFAKVSIRTLRHYDEVGLLRPARVDPDSGYRFYEAGQLVALNRILALKDLGFSLAEITRTVESGVSNDELLGMLRLRQTEAERAAEREQQRLHRVAARIALLTGERSMTESSIVIKPLDGVRVALTSSPADGFDVDFAPMFAELYPRLFGTLGRLGVQPAGPAWGMYEERSDGRIDVFAAVPIADDATLDDSSSGEHAVDVRDLPPVTRAATLIHNGSMATIRDSYAAISEWIDAAGETPVGFSREVYLDCPDDQDDWVTELQFVLA